MNHLIPVCRVDLELDVLTHNLEILQRAFSDADPVCMVKADAYGHGKIIVAKHLENSGVKWFGVATVEEGIELRAAGIQSRILVMSGAGAQFFVSDLAHYELTPLVSSVDEIDAILSKGDIPVHLDLDTGMSRGGMLSLDEPKSVFQFAKQLNLEGVSTHFAKAEIPDCRFSASQLERFVSMLGRLVRGGLVPNYIHVDKSASILMHLSAQARHEIMQLLPSARFLARPGIALYGIDPTGSHHGLRSVLSWRAPIVLRKTLSAGTPVGYDGTFVTERESEVALVRVGYGDGLKRMLGNRGHMIVAGLKAPIVGRISMDLSVIDVSEVVAQKGSASCEPGRFALIIGSEGESSQSAYDLAKACDTIPYEILTSIAPRVHRFAS